MLLFTNIRLLSYSSCNVIALNLLCFPFWYQLFFFLLINRSFSLFLALRRQLLLLLLRAINKKQAMNQTKPIQKKEAKRLRATNYAELDEQYLYWEQQRNVQYCYRNIGNKNIMIGHQNISNFGGVNNIFAELYCSFFSINIFPLVTENYNNTFLLHFWFGFNA